MSHQSKETDWWPIFINRKAPVASLFVSGFCNAFLPSTGKNLFDIPPFGIFPFNKWAGHRFAVWLIFYITVCDATRINDIKGTK